MYYTATSFEISAGRSNNNIRFRVTIFVLFQCRGFVHVNTEQTMILFSCIFLCLRLYARVSVFYSLCWFVTVCMSASLRWQIHRVVAMSKWMAHRIPISVTLRGWIKVVIGKERSRLVNGDLVVQSSPEPRVVQLVAEVLTYDIDK